MPTNQPRSPFARRHLAAAPIGSVIHSHIRLPTCCGPASSRWESDTREPSISVMLPTSSAQAGEQACSAVSSAGTSCGEGEDGGGVQAGVVACRACAPSCLEVPDMHGSGSDVVGSGGRQPVVLHWLGTGNPHFPLTAASATTCAQSSNTGSICSSLGRRQGRPSSFQCFLRCHSGSGPGRAS